VPRYICNTATHAYIYEGGLQAAKELSVRSKTLPDKPQIPTEQLRRIPPALSMAEAALWLRRAALAMSGADAALMSLLASFLQSLIPEVEKQDEQKAKQGQ
jgi:hypothetical protein